MTKGANRAVPLWQFLVSIGGLSVVFALVVVAIVKIDERDQREDDQEELDLNYLNCLRGNEIRRVNIENESEPGQPLDLSQLLSGDEPKWFTDFVERLKATSDAAASAPIDPNSRTGRRIARLQAQLRDCEMEWMGHTPGLRLPHTSTTEELDGAVGEGFPTTTAAPTVTTGIRRATTTTARPTTTTGRSTTSTTYYSSPQPTDPACEVLPGITAPEVIPC